MLEEPLSAPDRQAAAPVGLRQLGAAEAGRALALLDDPASRMAPDPQRFRPARDLLEGMLEAAEEVELAVVLPDVSDRAPLLFGALEISGGGPEVVGRAGDLGEAEV